MQNIPFSCLPQTFQDAVRVTRALDIPYLWIDSLCIVQGDAQDWEVEAAKMGPLYQNAYLTIAATKASGSTEGLFISSSPTLKLEVCTPENSLGESTHLYVRPWVWFELSPERSPLLRRAWVFQEMMLSRRTIHFAEEQLYWSCGTCRASENSLKQDHSQLMRAWCSIAVGYSRGALTFTKDKFPALAGII
ncbi:Heterokaryon incompatibility protein (HET) domain containing protein [Hyaloscypha variabilis]